MSVSLQVLGKAICPVLISRSACLYEYPPVRFPFVFVVPFRMWSITACVGLIPACAGKTRAFNLLHSKYSRSCSTIQHHYDSPGMTKARDPRPALKQLAGFPRLIQTSGLQPPLSLGHFISGSRGVPTRQVERNRDRSGKLALACEQNAAHDLPNKKLVAPTSVGATA